MAKEKPLTKEQKLEIAKGLGRGVVEVAKANKVATYTITSLLLLALGKARLVSCGVVGTLQGVNTYIAISEMVEENVDAGFFGVGGLGETIAKGGTAITIGALWGVECEAGKQKYSDAKQGTVKQKSPIKQEVNIGQEIAGGIGGLFGSNQAAKDVYNLLPFPNGEKEP